MSRDVASRVLSILAGVFFIISFIIGIALFGVRAVIILIALLLALALFTGFGGEMTPEDQALIWSMIIGWVIVPFIAMAFWLIIGILALVWQSDTYSRRPHMIVLGVIGVVFSAVIGVVMFLDPFFAALTGFWLVALASLILALLAGIFAIIAGAIAVPKGGI